VRPIKISYGLKRNLNKNLLRTQKKQMNDIKNLLKKKIYMSVGVTTDQKQKQIKTFKISLNFGEGVFLVFQILLHFKLFNS
jgi:hypothetical protein